MLAPLFPLSMLENGKMLTSVRGKQLVNIALGWGGEKFTEKDIF